MHPTDLFALLTLALLVKHYIADIPLQTTWMALNKGTFLHIGGIIHAGIHGTLSLLTLALLKPWLPPLSWEAIVTMCLAEFALHYVIDFSKMNLDRMAAFSKVMKDDEGNVTGRLITSTYYYWSLVGDQCLHFATYIAMSWWLLR